MKVLRSLSLSLPLLAGCAAPPAWQPAAREEAARLDAARITSGELRAARFGPARWLDGAHYATLEPAGGSGAPELVRYAAVSGERTVLVSAAMLEVPSRSEPLTIEDYRFSPDGRRLLVFTDSKRVWRQNTRGEYFVLPLDGSSPPRRLGGSLPASSLMFAKFSPDGTRVGYVSQNDLYVEDLGSGAVTRLTIGGSASLIHGTFDWVYEEEFDCRDGFRWSPDGTRIAYWQLDAEGVGEFLMIDNLSDRYSRVVPVQFPKAGTTNSACRIGVVPAAGGETVWMRTPGDRRETYLPRMEWHTDGAELMVQWLPRRQNELRVLACDAATGETRVVYEERDAAYIDVREDFRWLYGGRAFFLTSDVTGWRQAHAIPWASGDLVAAPLCPASGDVIEVEHVDAADPSRGLYLSVAGGTGFGPGSRATQKQLVQVTIDGVPDRVTPAELPGWHDYQVSPDGSLAIHTYSRLDEPPVIDLVRLPSHERVRVLVDNHELRARWAAIERGEHELFRITTADGVELDGWTLYPADFDPARSWPVVFHVYGEPWGQTVLDTWFLRHHPFHRWLNQLGYVVMSVDARGTPAPKGRAWRKALYQKIGVLSSHDWHQAVRALQQRHAFIDRARCAVWGWSGGGAMTLNLLFRHPDLFAAGMAVAPVTDIALYDTIYQERYCGIPQEVPQVYRDCSPVNFAQHLRGHLLLVHGTGDDNVHYQHSERLVDALIRHGKLFEFLAYPNRTHGISEGEGTRAHLYAALADFLQRRVPAGTR